MPTWSGIIQGQASGKVFERLIIDDGDAVAVQAPPSDASGNLTGSSRERVGAGVGAGDGAGVDAGFGKLEILSQNGDG